MKKLLYTIILYASLVFLCITLYKNDYLHVPLVVSWSYISISIIFLCAGFLINCYAWKKTLLSSGFEIKYTEAIASLGITVFGKYLPGKFWSILNRSAYLSVNKKERLTLLTLTSVNAQVLCLLAGTSLGLIATIFVKVFSTWGIIILFAWIALVIVVFFPTIIMNFIGKSKRSSPTRTGLGFLPPLNSLRLIPIYFLLWISWTLGFAFFSASINGVFLPIAGLGFPLAATIGMMAVFVPGGLGIREGILSVYLIMCGLYPENATTISIASRLWFLFGEFFIFLTGVICHMYMKFYSNERK